MPLLFLISDRLRSIAISDRARAARRTCASSFAQLCDPPEAQLRWGIETLH